MVFSATLVGPVGARDPFEKVADKNQPSLPAGRIHRYDHHISFCR